MEVGGWLDGKEALVVAGDCACTSSGALQLFTEFRHDRDDAEHQQFVVAQVVAVRRDCYAVIFHSLGQHQNKKAGARNPSGNSRAWRTDTEIRKLSYCNFETVAITVTRTASCKPES